MNIDDRQSKVFQLVIELEQTRKQKRDTSKAFNEEIKRLQDEIKELIEQENTDKE